MKTLIHADIFFFIASVATVIMAILVSIILFYVIKAGKNLYIISEALKDDFKESEEFIAELKERLEDNLVFQFFFPLSRRNHRTKMKDKNTKKTHN